MPTALDDPILPPEVFEELDQLLARGAPRAEVADRLGPWLDELHRPYFTLRLKHAVLTLYRRGLEPQDLAERLAGVLKLIDDRKQRRAPKTSSVIRGLFRHNGRGHRRVVTKREMVRAVAELRAMGMSVEAIAQELHLGRKIVEGMLLD